MKKRTADAKRVCRIIGHALFGVAFVIGLPAAIMLYLSDMFAIMGDPKWGD